MSENVEVSVLSSLPVSRLLLDVAHWDVHFSVRPCAEDACAETECTERLLHFLPVKRFQSAVLVPL